MQSVEVIGDRGRAATYLAGINLKIVKAAGARRSGHRMRQPGARPPASIAGAPVSGEVLKETFGDGVASDAQGGLLAEVKLEPITAVGYRTAVRSLPRILAAMPETDPRRRAAVMLADAVERVGSVAGVDWQGSAPKSAVSDGGATTRVKHAARLSMIQALANGWQIERGGKIQRADPRLVLRVGRQTGALREIPAFVALLAVCVDGLSADEILRRHGWAAKTPARKRLISGVLAALDDVADGLGLGRAVK